MKAKREEEGKKIPNGIGICKGMRAKGEEKGDEIANGIEEGRNGNNLSERFEQAKGIEEGMNLNRLN